MAEAATAAGVAVQDLAVQVQAAILVTVAGLAKAAKVVGVAGAAGAVTVAPEQVDSVVQAAQDNQEHLVDLEHPAHLGIRDIQVFLVSLVHQAPVEQVGILVIAVSQDSAVVVVSADGAA